MKRIEGRVAVVTGAGGGIGRATAVALAARGCALALCDVDERGLEETARAAVAASSRAASSRGPSSAAAPSPPGSSGSCSSASAAITTARVDVASAPAMADFARAVERDHGAAHILVNNAGVVIAGPFSEQRLEDLAWLVGINYWGVVHGCHFFLPLIRRQDEGHIVNLSSMFGFLGLPGQSGYCATKAAVRALSESLYAELREERIGVTTVHPGCIDTSIVRSGRMDDEAMRASVQALFDRAGAPPEVVAAAIVRAIERNRLFVRVRAESFATDLLKRLLPIGVHRLVASRWARRPRAVASDAP